MGEGGTVGAPAAIANAVADALRPLGVSVTRLPIQPETVSRGLRASTGVASMGDPRRGSQWRARSPGDLPSDEVTGEYSDGPSR